ncbi:hypothetical protein F4677DRAFT_447131 [Hypoxylon crocopeplum]|nr:hypothetical protein F4677DRAFT_447131 [Hypoxylon crocopeplum]
MLQRPQDLLTAHDLDPASSVSYHHRLHYHNHQQHNPYRHRVVARLQPVTNCQINSFTSFDKTWNATKAELVARWAKLNANRRLHRFKRSMVKKLTSFSNSVDKSQLPGPTSAGYSQSGTARLVACPARPQTENLPAVEHSQTIDQTPEQCLAELSVCKEDLNTQKVGSELWDLPQQHLRSAGPMESERKAGAAQRFSHCQLNHGNAYEASEASEHSACNSGSSGSGIGDSGQGQSGRLTRTKRRLGGDDQDDSSAGGDGGDSNRGGSKRAKKDTEPERKFACPFYKHDPKAHSKHRSCTGPGWTSLHRLKEHLYRVHRLPKHNCPRCNDPFEDARDLAEHLRADVLCEKLEVVLVQQGIDETTEAELKVRKKNCPGMTDEQRWRDIYIILFPTANPKAIPSPYYDANDSLGLTERAEEWRRVKKRIQKELPKVVQKKVEKSFEKVGAEVLTGLPDIVRDGLFEIFKDSSYDDRSTSVTPAATPRPPTPIFPAAREHSAVTADEPLDLSYYLESDVSFSFGGLDDLDFCTPFDFGNSAECLDKGSDSGYASTGTVGNGPAEIEI